MNKIVIVDDILQNGLRIVEQLKNSNLDYGTLSKTEEYKMALANSPMLQSFTDTFKGLQITLTGDLYQMIFSGIDNVKLVILYKVIDTECYYATVEVKG